jgi:hypothetical protein
MDNLYINKTTQNKEMKNNSFILQDRPSLIGNFIESEALMKKLMNKPLQPKQTKL